jgi:uncharacterized protein YndB with AHSA1/START domain
MTSFPEQGSASIEIGAAPEKVWSLIADVTRMGEWSPECVRAEWADGATGPEVGAHFHGYNKAGTFEWDVPCIVTVSDAGRVFEFLAPRGGEIQTRWRFEMAPNGAGTTLTESFDAPMINLEGAPPNFEGRFEMMVDAIGATIANIKTAAEA